MTSNSWDAAPFPARGDQSPETLFIEVGRALTEWELFEERLSWIFALLVTDRPGEPGQAAIHSYGSIASFRGRSDMVGMAAAAYLAERPASEAVAKLKPFLTRANDFATRRNEIAHGIVQPFYSQEVTAQMQVDLEDSPEPDGFALMPATYNSRKNELAKAGGFENPVEFLIYRQPRYAYTGESISKYGNEFRGLFGDCSRIWWAINHELWMRRRSASP